MRIHIEALKFLVQELYCHYGFEDSQAEIVADSLVDADARGIHSHGVQRLAMYEGKIRAGTIIVDRHPELVHETSVSAVIDGHEAMGQLVAHQSMSVAIHKAQQSGIGLVTVRNSNHFGTAGYFARMASQHHLLGFAATNSNPLMVPTHAAQPFLGSNPMAIAVPCQPHDIVFDAATTTVSLGKIEMLSNTAQPIPEQWALSESGGIEHSPDALLSHLHNPEHHSGLTPLGGAGEQGGGYKGFGLALVVEILTSVLSGGLPSVDVRGRDISHCFAAVDIDVFGDAQAFQTRLMDMTERLLALPSSDHQNVQLPGDKEEQELRRSQCNGIDIDELTTRVLNNLAAREGLEIPWL
ncbi:Ldh family oxidoreductase [Bifidobacterium sp.]|uniref:Ldh family oxidoreductase n=1 Tax=Bifidobacterium sp. TaxID=41200 RepID=UPI0025C2D6ED|nr:Ldh family oxidoreductase [Bifidobacterium sp.]MCI1636212.1 Ldh family oxidoreductase [Bifidobacterium sp.]